ncbi:MAG: hypothetical protein KF893_09135 [Caldilineaceae bacterium]|nr:hypothetical protein [Caldilineaceae bacterium]
MIERVDAKAVRLAMGRLLASADLRPPAMPPSTVLVVRRMVDPEPGRMAAGLRATTVHREWERRAREQLADLYRRAAHPALGFVPDSVEAVCFADESELLACLACDIHSGVVGQRWWWRAILLARGSLASPADLLVDRLIARAELLPAVAAQLESWGEAGGIVERFTPAQAGRILAAMLIAHQLPHLIPSDDATGRSPRSWGAAPWAGLSASIPLGREQTALLGIALDLHRRPYRVHAPDYAPRLRAWWRAVTRSSAESLPTGKLPVSPRVLHSPHWQRDAISDPSSQIESAATTPIAELSSRVVEADPLAPAADALASNADEPSASVAHPLQPTERAYADPTGSAAKTAPSQRYVQPGAANDPLPSAGRSTVAPASPNHPLMQESTAEAAPASIPTARAWAEEGLPTRVGGVLYLINLMITLDLPESFENGWRLSSGVGPWGLLEALGRELLGDGFAAVETDPLWLALARLDGRPPGDLPGCRLPRRRPRRWPAFQIPAAWLRFGLVEDGGRIKLRQKYHPLLARWLRLALPLIEWRLRLALRLEPEMHLAEELLLLPGQLYITASQVDLVASLDSISLPIRLTGLDRDPGWLPGWGRAVYFHFG